MHFLPQLFKRSLIAIGLGWGCLNASALTDLLRADFEGIPAGSAPDAYVGTILTQAGAEVRVGEGLFPGGSMRFQSGGSVVNQRWNFAASPRAGDCSLSWEMTISAYPVNSAIHMKSQFEDAEVTGVYRWLPVSFWPGGSLQVNNELLAAYYLPGVRHRYRISHDMTTGRFRFYVDDELAHEGYISVHQRMRWHHIDFGVPASYAGTVWVDNIRAVCARPWVALIGSDFESYPLLATPAEGAIPLYPHGDRLSDLVATPLFDNLDIVTDPDYSRGQSLRVRNDDNSGMNLELDPYLDPPPDGRYRVSYSYRATGERGRHSMLVVGSAANFAMALNQFENGELLVNSNLLTEAVSILYSNRTYHVEMHLDTVLNQYSLALDGYEHVTGWPVFDPGTPRKLKITTGNSPTDTAYLDNISMERRGREGLYCFYGITTSSQRHQYVQVIRDGLQEPGFFQKNADTQPLQDAVFAADGWLYTADSSSNCVHRVNPATMQTDGVVRDPLLARVRSLAPLKNGDLLALAEDPSRVGRVLRLTTHPFALEEVLLEGFRVNADTLRLTPDERHVYISYPSTRHLIEVYRYPELTLIGNLACSTNIPNIHAFDISPSGLLYVVDRVSTNVVVLDPVADQRLQTFGDPGGAQELTDIAVLPNGDLAVGGRSIVMMLDGTTGERISSYDLKRPTPHPHYLSALAAGPTLRIRDIEPAGTRTHQISYQAEPMRFHDVFYTPALPGGWQQVRIQLPASNYVERATHTHTPSRDRGFYHISESGL